MIFKKKAKPQFKFNPVTVVRPLFEKAMSFAKKFSKRYDDYDTPLCFGYYWGWADCETKYTRCMESYLRAQAKTEREISEFMEGLREQINLELKISNEYAKQNKI